MPHSSDPSSVEKANYGESKQQRRYDQLQFLDGAAGKLVHDLTKDEDRGDEFPFPFPAERQVAREERMRQAKPPLSNSDPLQTLLHSTGRIVHDMTATDDGDDGEMGEWLDGDSVLSYQRQRLVKRAEQPEYAAPSNRRWSSQMKDLDVQKRKLREAYEAKKAKEMGQQKRPRTDAVPASADLYAINQPNVTEATDEINGVRRGSDFTNPCLAQFDLYEDKGGPSSSSVDKVTGLKKGFNVASFMQGRKKQAEATPMSLSASASSSAKSSLEDRVRNEQQVRQLMLNQASHEKAREAKIAEGLRAIDMDLLYSRVLGINLRQVVQSALKGESEATHGRDGKKSLESVPSRFRDANHYKSIFMPLLLVEIVASLGQHILQPGGGVNRKKKVQASAWSFKEVTVVAAREHHPSSESPSSDTGMSSGGDMIEVDICVERERHGGGGDTGLRKEDLVVLFNATPPACRTADEIFKALAAPHCLSIATSSLHREKRKIQPSGHGNDISNAKRGGGGGGHGERHGDRELRQTLFLPSRTLGGRKPRIGLKWHAVAITSLSNICREWAAIQSLHIPELFPLASYILKGAPVVSANALVEARNRMALLVQSLTGVHLEYLRVSSEENHARVLKLVKALDELLASLRIMPIDGSALAQSAVGKALNKSLVNNPQLAAFPDLVQTASSLKEQWKSQVKRDLNESTLKNLKGGNRVLVTLKSAQQEAESLSKVSPEKKRDFNLPPRGCPEALWSVLRGRYNQSQLYSIKHVGDKLLSHTGLDTQIALLQGPPGTGKSTTILGMISMFLSRGMGMVPAASSSSSTSGSDASATATSSSSPSDNGKANKPRLLLCTPSNAACDELLARILREGVLGGDGLRRSVNVVRLGEVPEGYADKQGVAALTLDRQVEAALGSHKKMEELTALEKQMKALQAKVDALMAPGRGSVNVDLWKAKAGSGAQDASSQQAHYEAQLAQLKNKRRDVSKDVEAVRAYLRKKIMTESDVVASTCSSAGKQGFVDHLLQGDISFEVCIIDEASQCTEPSSLVPLKYGCRNLVLVGDTAQLPATVISPDAESAGLGGSLFERLERCGHEVVMLSTQYRMHPELRVFPSERFYQGQLEDSDQIKAEVGRETSGLKGGGGGDVNNGHSDGEVNEEGEETGCTTRTFCAFGGSGGLRIEDAGYLRTPTVLEVRTFNFFDLKGSAEQTRGTSLVNPTEAVFSVFLARRLVLHFGEGRTVAIITPYKAQAQLIRSHLSDEERGRVEVNTVDGFQGREKDCVVFCCVRDGKQGGIGFLADERRLNVGITRARAVLAIVGNTNIEHRNSTWRALIASARSRSRLVTVETL